MTLWRRPVKRFIYRCAPTHFFYNKTGIITGIASVGAMLFYQRSYIPRRLSGNDGNTGRQHDSNVGTAVQWRLSADIQGRGPDHIAFRDHNAVFVLGVEAIATNFLSVVLF